MFLARHECLAWWGQQGLMGTHWGEVVSQNSETEGGMEY